LAEADVFMAREHLAYMQRMGRRGFMSENQVRADRFRAEKVDMAFDQVREELHLLDEYGYHRTLTELEGKTAEARRGVQLAKEQARAKEVQAASDRLSKQRVYQQLLNRFREIETEAAKCRITAPHEGMVLYHMSDHARNGLGNQTLVAEGEQVREGQLLMRVAQLKHMVVRTWVHEALIAHVHGESDVASRSCMQKALIRVDAYPDRVYHGHVLVVGAVPWMVNGRMDGTLAFQTTIAIDEPAEELRPDMSARVTILMDDETPKNVLTVPVDAIWPGIGNHRKCYVLTEEGPQEREVVVGLYNDDFAQIVSGLEEGEEVVLNPDGMHHSSGSKKHRRAHRR
jgi:multidrug efflux pump subunit AcrA (membrane-fusion protein)